MAVRHGVSAVHVRAGPSDPRSSFGISGRSGALTSPVYVHAKIGIVDDRWLTLGSANLNEHSLFNDTELNVVTCDAALARQTRLLLDDPDRRSRLGEAGRKHVAEHHSVTAMVEQCVGLYEEELR